MFNCYQLHEISYRSVYFQLNIIFLGLNVSHYIFLFYCVYFTVCENPPVLAGATIMTQNPGPYFLDATVTYQCNGNLTTFNSTNRSFINRCVRQMDGSLDWMTNNNNTILCGCKYSLTRCLLRNRKKRKI